MKNRTDSFNGTFSLAMDDLLAVYERDGAVVIRAAFGEDWVEIMRNGVDRVLADPGPFDQDYAAPDGTGSFFEAAYLWNRYREFKDFAFQSPAGFLARYFMRSRSSALFYDQVFVKEAGTTKRTPWHQDKPYWAIQGSQMCSMWIALDDITSDNGVSFVAGSHLWGEHQASHFLDGSSYEGQDHLPVIPDMTALNRKHQILTWPLLAGDCIIFHPLTIHGSQENPSTSMRRRAFAIRWIGDDVTYHRTRRESAFPRGEHDLRDGEPLPAHVAPIIS